MRLLVVFSALVAAATAKPSYQSAPVYGYHGPAAPLAHDGQVVDTPEVVNAKAAHFAAHAEATARANHGHSGYDGYDNTGVYDVAYTVPIAQGYSHGYHGPSAPLAHDGRVIDTPEVAHARAAHLAAHAQEAAKTSHYREYDNGVYESYDGQGYPGTVQLAYAHPAPVGYRGPPAPLDHEGRVVDTPEVAHAKAVHLQAHAQAASRTAHYAYAAAPAHGYENKHYY